MTYFGIYVFSSQIVIARSEKESCKKSKERGEDVSWKRKLVSEKQEMAEQNQKKKELLKVECAYGEERLWKDKR